ncbi:RNA 2',3'-cyclic phosphodiesterase [Chelatococcus reniformis]|uniref:RNA 2',3'-cyclic phosphodiesterase n=1 Tax=Chelatococcus reniformis TaxID=1494448 RepID=A0A916TYH8_9HYPH|nr:RNA 2',3'-cyclic phosphodiesterase [Chelatococcus reniformis]GGC50797.1 RNA 2',3'-cyclic phosphodiesterase [Chelatococcus reniformis]
MPRLFTGLEIPSDMSDALARMRGGLPGARWIDQQNYHITLRFIGDIDHATARDIDAALGEVHREPVAVTLDSLSAFGGGRPRAVIARVAPTAALAELQADQERRVRSAGIPPEGRKFTPHVTLARLRDASPMDVADYLALRGAFPTMRFTAYRFVLFSSRDSVGGGPYVIEAAYPLG